jgi:hypothetical protein
LEPYHRKNPEREVVDIEANDSGWKRESIVASGPSNDDSKKHVYQVKCDQIGHEDNKWEKYDNIDEHAHELLEEF